MSATACHGFFDGFEAGSADPRREVGHLRLVSTNDLWGGTSQSVDEANWFAELNEQLRLLKALPEGWDGYCGLPVSEQVAVFTRQMLERIYFDGLPHPSLVPGSDGSLQVEWHQNGLDIELDVLGPQEVAAFKAEDCAVIENEELTISNDFSVIHGWVRRLR